MKAIYAILVFISPFLISCNKDSGPTTVEGRVTEKGSNKAIAGAEVMLKSQPQGSMMAIFSTDTTVYTDVNGKYAISFEADKERSYEVQPKHSLYDNTNCYKSVSGGRKNKTDLELNPYAWVKVYIINEPPLDTVKYIDFAGFYNQPNNVRGFCKDTFLIGKANGNSNNPIIISWRYNILNSEEQKKYDNIYTVALDTVNYYFKY